MASSVHVPTAVEISVFALGTYGTSFQTIPGGAKDSIAMHRMSDYRIARRPFPDLPVNRGDHDMTLFLPPCYLLGSTIGRGEFSTVKLAYNLRTNEYVAVKCFNRRSGTYMMLDEQLIRELVAMKGLANSHIVQMHEAVIYGDKAFMVMEYCPLGDLRKFINNGGSLDEALAREFFSQLLLGIRKMHSLDLIHRDLKLENLLIDSHIRLKIADLGCARRQIGKMLNTITGSYAYGAPELFRGDRYDGKKTDVWSMGVILYAMLVGRLPYSDRGSVRSLVAERTRIPRLPSSLSAESRDLVMRMLSYDPDRRINTGDILSHPWMLLP